MRPIVSARDVSKSFGSVLVMQGAGFDMFERDRVGLVGPNGSGKTTLLKLITGEERTDLGVLEARPGLRIGSLTQYQTQDSRESVAENLQTSDYLTGVYAELRAIEARMIDPDFYNADDYEEAMQIYGERQTELAKFEGDRFVDRTVELLSDLGFELDLAQPIYTLSGGERRKLALAKLLVASPELDLLLLDEPTNHLDIETIEWLEQFLLDYEGSIIIVSHDRYLLDDTVERIFEMEGSRLKTYTGDYTDYVEQKELIAALNRKAYKKYIVELKRNKEIIQKLKGRNKYDAQIKSRLKRMAKIARIDDPIIREKVVKFKFKEAGFHSRFAIVAEDLGMRFGDNVLFTNANFEIENGDKIGIIGPNGCGKTTLLKIFMGEVEPTGGTITRSKVLKAGYFDQGHISLNQDNDPIEELRTIDDKIHEFDAKALLGRFMFKGDMVHQEVSKLSGGEKARLSILKLVLSPQSLLLLDEPTNHLDIPAQHVVAAAINSYQGTVGIVSHDRYFLDSVANKIISFRNGNLEVCSGNYTNYRQLVASGRFDEKKEEIIKYMVTRKFTEWSTGRKFVQGDTMRVSDEDFESFRFAIETGRLVPVKEEDKDKKR